MSDKYCWDKGCFEANFEPRLPKDHDGKAIYRTVSCGESSFLIIATTWELIDVETAKYYMSFNTKNRNKIDFATNQYISDIQEGQWVVSHEGIAFDCTVALIDGQHRLDAIIKSGKALDLLVTRNLPQKSLEVINRGRMRKLSHTLQILGYEISNTRFTAIARRMFLGVNLRSFAGTKITESDLKNFLDNNLDAIAFAYKCVPRNLAPAGVAAVIGRAYYHEDLEDLTRFIRAMSDSIPIGEVKPGDKSARLLKSCIDKTPNQSNMGYSETLYTKTQYALKNYLLGVDISRLLEIKNELYKIEEDSRWGSVENFNDL